MPSAEIAWPWISTASPIGVTPVPPAPGEIDGAGLWDAGAAIPLSYRSCCASYPPAKPSSPVAATSNTHSG